MRHIIIALSAALLLAAPVYAQDTNPAPQNEATSPAQEEPELSEPDSAPATAAQRLLPESVNLTVVEGSSVPADCQYPSTISDTTSFELACVTMPQFGAGLIGAEYLAQLGQLGWRQGDYIEGGMTAVRTDENNCQRVLNLFPSNFPPGEERATTTVIWFVLERAPRCAS
ncbi:MAG TPA: hypothetical protein VFO00_14160 [Vitreimonas sp.]|nr:hypothetical protein [Vitreimonas sp.]